MTEYKRINTHNFFIGSRKRKIKREVSEIVEEIFEMYPGCTMNLEIKVKIIEEPDLDILDRSEWKKEQNRLK